MRKTLLTIVLLLTATVSWAYEEMETCPFVHNINGVWYQIKDGEAWVSSRWHFGYELMILQDWNSYSGDVVIPETIQWAEEDNPDTPEVEGGGETYPVVGIMEGAFNASENLTSVSIPHSVRTIENMAFTSCTNLTEITFPSSVESIGAGVCEYCSGLKRVIIEDGPNLLQWNFLCNDWAHLGVIDEVYVGRPYKTPENNSAFKALPMKKITFGEYVEEIYPEDVANCSETLEEVVLKGVKRIGRQAFDGNWILQSVTLNEGLVYIDDEAFNFCGMSTITLPSTLIHIGNGVFKSCTNLTEISIPASVEYTGTGLLEFCSSLRKVTLEDGPNLLQWNFACYDWAYLGSLKEVYVGRPYQTPENRDAFRALPLKKITFGGYVENILEEDAAWMTETLETVILGKGIKRIHGSAFAGDMMVNQLYVKAVEPPYVDGETLGHISPETCTLYVPQSSLEAYKAAPVWKDFFNIQGIEDEPLTTTVTLYGFDGSCSGDFYDSQNNYKVPDGVYACVVTGIDNDKNELETPYFPDGIIPKGVAVALWYEGPNGTVITLTSVDEATPYTGTNWLFGSDVETITTAPYEAIFSRQRFGNPGSANENNYRWYKEDENGSPFISEAHRAWLATPKEASSIKGLILNPSSSASDCYYDLQGRKVTNPQTPGIYIHNGKKVVVKSLR